MLDAKNIVIFGAHPDDIEMGMGGTLNQLKKYKPRVIVFSDTVQYNGEQIQYEFYKSMESIGINATLFSYEVDYLLDDIVEIRKEIYKYKDADMFFSTSVNSTHQDHRLIGQAVNDIMLEKTVLFYEDIRSGQQQNLNCYNPISKEDLGAKYNMLSNYHTQKKKHYFTQDAVATMAKFRGGQIKVDYAEAFEVKRLVMSDMADC